MTRVLGAVLAGGQARRFGSDKALAPVDGVAMIDRVIAALAPQVDGILICGRAWGDHASVPDDPSGGLGPLAGLNAALHYAVAHGHDRVLSVPCDTPYLPANLREILGEDGAFMARQPVIGIWPATLAATLSAHLAKGDDRSMRGWARLAGAHEVAGSMAIANVNTRAELADLPRP